MQIDQRKVETALMSIRADVPLNQSQLAEALQNPNLNQSERDAIIQELASGDESGLMAFYANDSARAIRDDPTLGADQQVIGEALQQAYEDGVIGADDLLRIADFNGAGNGAQRFLTILESGGGGRPNGTVEALSDALWERNGNDGLDRAGAAIGYTSSPELQSRNLNTPELRREAFEALVDFNEAAPYKDIPAGSLATQWESGALNAAGTLFVNNSAELIDFYTGANGGTVQTETLARFMAQTVFNPDASSIVLDRQRDLVPAIESAISNHADRLLAGAADAPADSREQEGLIEQFARLDASISGGVAVAMDRYSDEILANEASKQQFSSIVGALVGKTPASKVPGSNLIVKEVAEAIYDALSTDPERPEQALAGVIHDAHFDQVRELADELGQTGLTSAFNGAYSAEATQIQQNLNVNFGGHKD
ncbi:hypothetical protein WCE55_01135 [Luteimonas sp. MJ293]|uniref:hypothetical protein n=1 Tax=Luteimonas sp. MJ146 TaxID=3129240 RepID=UPI0031BAA123